MNYDMKKSGERIQQLRTQHGYTQGKLARELNVDRSFLSYVESGKKGCSIDLLVQLSTLLDVSLDYIVLGKEWHNALMSKSEVHLKADIDKLICHLEEFNSTQM